MTPMVMLELACIVRANKIEEARTALLCAADAICGVGEITWNGNPSNIVCTGRGAQGEQVSWSFEMEDLATQRVHHARCELKILPALRAEAAVS